MQEERQIRAHKKQSRAACVLQAVVRGWLVRVHVQPLIHEHRAWRRQQEERQTRTVLFLQARCRGWVFRRTMKVDELKERREKMLENLALCMTYLQARARGKLLREATLENRLKWQELRGAEGTNMFSRLQGVCRGYLLRRITTSILQNIRQTRIKETKHTDTEVESKGRKGSTQSIHFRKISNDIVKAEVNRSSEVVKQEVGKAVKKSGLKVKGKTVDLLKGEKVVETSNDRIIIRLQAQLRGMMSRRKLQSKMEKIGALCTEDEGQPSLARQHQQQLPALAAVALQQQLEESPQIKELEDEYRVQELQEHSQERGDSLALHLHQVAEDNVGAGVVGIDTSTVASDDGLTHSTGATSPTCSIALEKSVLTNSVGKLICTDEKDELNSFKKKVVEEIFTAAAYLGVESGGELPREAAMARQQPSVSPAVMDLAKESRTRSTYVAELRHASQPLSGHALLGVLVERLNSWQESQMRRKTRLPREETTDDGLKTDGALRIDEHQSCVSDSGCPLTEGQMLASSPANTSLEEVVQVHVQLSGSTPALSSLKVCPRLQSLTLSRCALPTLAGLQDCPELCQLQVPVGGVSVRE